MVSKQSIVSSLNDIIHEIDHGECFYEKEILDDVLDNLNIVKRNLVTVFNEKESDIFDEK